MSREAAPASTTAGPVLRLQGVHKQRGSRTVLQGLSLELQRGEVFGLLGPNGCGKSTTLHIAGGLLRADAGSVLVEGAAAGPGTRARVGLCPQQPALYRELRPAENLDFFARLYGVPAAERAHRVAALEQRFGLAPHAATPAGQLSGGWQQRLNLAVALVHEPALLLLDEPTAAVDLQARQEIGALIASLPTTGTTVLMTTHDIDEAQALCHRIGLMQGGRLAAVGTPAELCALVPGRAVATVITPDPAAVRARAAAQGWPVRERAGALACLLPQVPHAGTLREVVQALDGVAVSSVSVQPVGLAHAYLEVMQAEGA